MALTRAAAAKMVRRIDLICILGIWLGWVCLLAVLWYGSEL
jgi:hypothetical protein